MRGVDDVVQSLVYFYGHVTPNKSLPLFKKLLAKLAETVKEKLASPINPDAAAGLIMNTCGWVEGDGFALLLEMIELFEIDVILVLGDERLYNQLKGTEGVVDRVVAKLAKSGGVVTRDNVYRRKLRMKSIRNYFYGPAKELCPHQQYFSFEELKIFRVGGGPQAPSSALPLGSKRLMDPNRLVPVDLCIDALSHHILAICFTDDEKELLSENVVGFLHILNVDSQKSQVTCLAPSADSLPFSCCLTGSVKWFD